jgi:hypothetical protein
MKTARILIPAAIAVLIAAPGILEARQDGRSDKPGTEAPAKAKEDPAKSDKAIIQAQRWSYPLATCPMTGEKLGRGMSEFVVDGRLVRTCCNGCKADVVKDPKPVIAKIDAAVIADQKPAYPLDTCAATGKKLDDKAIDHVHGTRLVRLADKDAVTAFEKDPKSAMAKVDAAWIKVLTPKYPLKTCVVSGEELGGMGDPYDKLYGTTLVRFCCEGCTSSFEKDPAPHLEKIAQARKPAK